MDASFALHGTILPSLVAIGIEVKAIFSICHMTLHDHMFEGSCDFMGGISSLYVTTLPSLLARYIVVVGIFLISHVIKKSKRRKKMTKWNNLNQKTVILFILICAVLTAFHEF